MKNLKNVIIYSLVICFTAITVFAEPYKYGDVDGDDIITAADALHTLASVLDSSKYPLTEQQFRAAAVCGNEFLSSADSSAILGKTLKASYIFEVEKDSTEASTNESTETTTEEITEVPTETATEIETTTETATETTTAEAFDYSLYNIVGFGEKNAGGGVVSEDSSSYIKVYNAADFGKAIKGKYKVIEIMNDLDLGYKEISNDAKNTDIYSSHNSPALSDILKQTGVSRVKFSGLSNMTIFSQNGAKIKHACIDLSGCSNIIIRNLEFDELWEWDEETTGDYDRNDWDYITVQGSNNVWIDHCTFNKAYDGVVDSKKGSTGLIISWCKVKSDTCTEGSWVTTQIEQMENDINKYPMYKFLRQTAGLTKQEIIIAAAGQKKTHLVGSNEFESDNENLTITLGYNYYENSHDRMPRLRAGNAHVYNTVMDSEDNYNIDKQISSKLSAVASQMSSKGYHFSITSNGALSTEDGAVLVENTHMIGIKRPLANNQKSSSSSKYTGKIKAENVLYELGGTSFYGGSDDEGTPLVPNGADVIKAFSWNNFNELPYSYRTLDVYSLKTLLSEKAGAGTLDWEKSNWLKNTVE